MATPFIAAFLAYPLAALAQSDLPRTITLSAAQLFAFADKARDAGKYAVAEKAYRALAENSRAELRIEARFRLAMMLADQQHKYRDAAVELRRILDDKPKASRVRLELARMQALLGNPGAAERELRAAEAEGDLPLAVEQQVRFYANALAAKKAFGGSLELALAPDSNINRATRSETLGTVLGNFTLDHNARARSGIGATVLGQIYGRMAFAPRANGLLRVSGSANIYSAASYDDFILSAQAGPELALGRGKLTMAIGPAWRWYGTAPYSVTLSASANWQHPLGRRSQLRVDTSIGHVTNRRNALQSGDSYALTLALDHAFSARFGGGVQWGAGRDDAKDPGFATANGAVSGYLFREIGKTTLVSSLGYSHLEAHARLLLFPQRRIDDRYTASLGATFRALRVGVFAPLARLRWERNRSTVGLYDYNRVAGEIGVDSAF